VHYSSRPDPTGEEYSIGTAFRTAVQRFAADNNIPLVRFGKHDRQIEVMRPYLARQARTGRSGVAAIGTAQEFQNVFDSAQRGLPSGLPSARRRSPARRCASVRVLPHVPHVPKR
jgi:hypothetical protein